MKKKYKFGELFSGPGGLALGALNAKITSGKDTLEIEHAWANDYDENTCKTYRKNLAQQSPETVIWKDVTLLDIENELKPIDIFAYGFPCNDFSVVGEQKGFTGKFGPLYSYGIKVLNKYKPLVFVAENVNGLTSANEGKAFKQILHDLSEAGDGYNLTINLYKAEEYGVPQTRHRIIIVGFAKSSGLSFKVPKPTTKENPVKVRDALEKPPILEKTPNNEKTNQSALVVERLKLIKPGQNVWNADLPEHLRLKTTKAKLSQIYKRLDPDKPSYTITGSGGGGTHGYHYSEPRALTNRERARIQTFPDTYVFEGNKESVRKQIGMAVPVKLANVIFEAILKTIAGVEYDYIKPKYDFKDLQISD